MPWRLKNINEVPKWESLQSHPLADQYPMMSAHNLGRIEQLIVQKGYDVRQPITLYEDKILDGRNRHAACVAAKEEPSFVELQGSPEDAALYVQMKNEERRMLEDLERRRQERIGRVVEARQEGESLRSIAAKEGTTVATVQRDLEKAGSTVPGGGTVEPKDGKVKGKDGRTRTAKPKSATKSTARNGTVDRSEHNDGPGEDEKAAPDAPEVAEESPVVQLVDALGHPVPEIVAPAFATLAKFEEADSLCRSLQKILDEIGRSPGGERLGSWLQATQSGERIIHKSEDLQKIKRHLMSRPYSICPYCAGKCTPHCKGCTGRGWLEKHTWNDLEDSVKARLS